MTRRFVSVLLVLALFLACCPLLPSALAADGEAPVQVKAVTITGSKYVAVGKKITLKAGQAVTWKSSNKKIATVSKKGVVKGIKAGSVKITAKAADGSRKTWKITVKAKAVKSIKIKAKTKELDLNGTKTVKLKASASPASAAQKFTWESSDPAVATVSAAGKVTAVAAGTAVITARAVDGSKKKKSVTITVKGGSGEDDPIEEETGPVLTKPVKIGVSMPTDMLQRWVKDGEGIRDGLVAKGYTTTLKFADNDINKQISQIESMIESGCNLLIISPIDGGGLNDVMKIAKKKGVAIISYDRLLWETDAVSYYVTFSNTKVGQLQGNYIKKALNLDSAAGPFYLEITAGDPNDSNGTLFYNGAMSVLKPYISSGKLIVKSGQTALDDVCTPGWRSETAQERAEDILAAHYADGSKLDAWLCVNDSTAWGVINALDSVYTNGHWPVITGQDCDLNNVRAMLAGKQSMSVLKQTKVLVARTVKMADQIATGAKVEVNSKVNNNAKSVSTFMCSPVVVDRNNYVEQLIDSGYYSADMLE